MLDFQHYFVRRRCEPIVRSIRFEGATTARPGPGVIDAISNPDCEAVLIAPSNPFLSVDPILAVPGIRERSEEHTSELQSLMRISYAVFCLKKKTNTKPNTIAVARVRE